MGGQPELSHLVDLLQKLTASPSSDHGRLLLFVGRLGRDGPAQAGGRLVQLGQSRAAEGPARAEGLGQLAETYGNQGEVTGTGTTHDFMTFIM